MIIVEICRFIFQLMEKALLSTSESDLSDGTHINDSEHRQLPEEGT
jgi:hypothetical protein